MRTLYVTVGGSPEPILTAVRSLRPDRVVFVCSGGPKGSLNQVTGAGEPCQFRDSQNVVVRSAPNLVKQLEIVDFDSSLDVVQVDTDDLTGAYTAIAEHMRATREQRRGELVADYTGGTKTMSAALAMASLDCGAQLYLTGGDRQNLVRVTQNPRTMFVSGGSLLIDRFLDTQLPHLLTTYNYAEAATQLRDALLSRDLRPERRDEVTFLVSYCEAFEAWDRFDHPRARQELNFHKRQPIVRDWLKALDRVEASRAVLVGEEPPKRLQFSGYEVLQDLVLNAERRRAQGRYDDAVGRYYRALELLAQIELLRRFQIRTGNVDLSLVPAHLQAEVDSGTTPIQLGLWKSYELLAGLGDNPVGSAFKSHCKALMNQLQVRNHSLFAHGFEPIDEARYREFTSVVNRFFEEAIEDSNPLEQFPRTVPNLQA